MQRKKLKVFLHTPLMIESALECKEKKTPETVVRLRGIVLEENAGGLWLEAEEFFNEKCQKTALTPRVVFLPFHKIDHALGEP